MPILILLIYGWALNYVVNAGAPNNTGDQPGFLTGFAAAISEVRAWTLNSQSSGVWSENFTGGIWKPDDWISGL